MTDAALRRARQEAGDLRAQVDRLKELNGALCAEVNEKADRIGKLEALALHQHLCLDSRMSCDQCELRPCNLRQRAAELLGLGS